MQEIFVFRNVKIYFIKTHNKNVNVISYFNFTTRHNQSIVFLIIFFKLLKNILRCINVVPCNRLFYLFKFIN